MSRIARVLTLGALLVAAAVAVPVFADGSTSQERTIKAKVQMRPGGPVDEVEMGVHEAPVDPPIVSASEATLDDTEVVLGLVIDGTPIAYPSRYLAMTEVMNDRVGDTAMSPTW